MMWLVFETQIMLVGDKNTALDKVVGKMPRTLAICYLYNNLDMINQCLGYMLKLKIEKMLCGGTGQTTRT